MIFKASQNNVKPALITNINQLEHRIDAIKASLPIKHIIIDFSCVNIIDSMGVSALVNVS
jgi:anti-anti-sigma regulatory factor